MSELSISTGSFYPKPTRYAIEKARALGFSTVEITLQNVEIGYDFHRTVKVSRFKDLARELKKLGLQATSVHAPFMTPEQVFSSKARSQILLSSLNITRIFEANEMIVHPYHLFASYEDAVRSLNSAKAHIPRSFLQSTAELLNLSEKYGILVALENIAHWSDSPLLNSPRNMGRLIGALKNRAVVNLDLYHSEMAGATLEFLDRLAEAIVSVHASDYTSRGKRTLPGNGNANWEKIGRRIKKLPNLRRIVLEMQGYYKDDETNASANFLREILK